MFGFLKDFFLFILFLPSFVPSFILIFADFCLLFLVVVKSFTCLVVCVYLSPSLPVNTGCLSLAWLQNTHINEQGKNLAASLFRGDGFLTFKKRKLVPVCIALKVVLQSFNRKILSIHFIMFEISSI